MNCFIHDRVQRLPFSWNADHAAGRSFDQRYERAALKGQMMGLNDFSGADDYSALDDVKESYQAYRAALSAAPAEAPEPSRRTA